MCLANTAAAGCVLQPNQGVGHRAARRVELPEAVVGVHLAEKRRRIVRPAHDGQGLQAGGLGVGVVHQLFQLRGHFLLAAVVHGRLGQPVGALVFLVRRRRS